VVIHLHLGDWLRSEPLYFAVPAVCRDEIRGLSRLTVRIASYYQTEKELTNSYGLRSGAIARPF
jgi:hypothetical protein